MWICQDKEKAAQAWAGCGLLVLAVDASHCEAEAVAAVGGDPTVAVAVAQTEEQRNEGGHCTEEQPQECGRLLVEASSSGDTAGQPSLGAGHAAVAAGTLSLSGERGNAAGRGGWGWPCWGPAL